MGGDLPAPTSTLSHGMLCLEGAQQRAVFGVREANEQPLAPGMLQRRPSHSHHDLMISISVMHGGDHKITDRRSRHHPDTRLIA